MKTKLITLLLCIPITGCMEDSQLRIAQAQYYCSEHGGIHQFKSISGLTCCDSTRATSSRLDKVVLPKDFKLTIDRGGCLCEK